jgi:hypothetical protein
VENSFDPSVARLHKERVDMARGRIAAGSYLSHVSREGGTGFPKLARLILHNQDKANRMNFGIAESELRFWIEFSLKARILGDGDGAT